MTRAVLVLLALLPLPARAAFERPPTGPEAAARGGLVAVSPDPVFGNPAALGAGSGVEVWGARPFGLPELAEIQVAWHGTRGRAGVGAGARRFGSERYGEHDTRLSFAWSPDPRVALGLCARGLVVSGTGLARRVAGALDAGFRVAPGDGTEVGVWAEAIAGDVPGGRSSRRAAFGASRRLGRGTLTLEAQRRGPDPLVALVGLSWPLSPTVALLGGVREEPPTLAWGLVAAVRGLRVAVSVSHVDSLGRTVRVGLGNERGATQRSSTNRSSAPFPGRF